MSSAAKRLSSFAAQFLPSSPPPIVSGSASTEYAHTYNTHQLSPTFFLPRAAEIEPDVRCPPCTWIYQESCTQLYQAAAIYHVTANKKILRRTYQEAADRARGLAYYLKHHNLTRVGILCPNTPAFFESIFGYVVLGLNVVSNLCC